MWFLQYTVEAESVLNIILVPELSKTLYIGSAILAKWIKHT